MTEHTVLRGCPQPQAAKWATLLTSSLATPGDPRSSCRACQPEGQNKLISVSRHMTRRRCPYSNLRRALLVQMLDK